VFTRFPIAVRVGDGVDTAAAGPRIAVKADAGNDVRVIGDRLIIAA
jgi:hypothetical protein